ncbi:hypothetical protein ABK040_002584 [Willaertia magna]
MFSTLTSKVSQPAVKTVLSTNTCKNYNVLKQVTDELWKEYLIRVPYARKYVDINYTLGGNVVNDHIALRTFHIEPTNSSKKNNVAWGGVKSLARVLKPFGYKDKGDYLFKDTHLYAQHFEFPEDQDVPKIFISQLEVQKLSKKNQKIIKEILIDAKDPLDRDALRLLDIVERNQSELKDLEKKYLSQSLLNVFKRQWSIPYEKDVLELNKESQYAAWTAIHGWSVNHFTAYINRQNISKLKTIEDTIDYLEKECKIPMKKGGIVGPQKLRQTATAAVTEKVLLRDENNELVERDWSYAYYEFAQRGKGENGELFNGFLAGNTPSLFANTTFSVTNAEQTNNKHNSQAEIVM